MEKTVFNVEGMSCEHCVKSVTQAVSALAGVATVAVELAAKTVTVEYDAAQCPPDKIKSAIDDLGFDVL